MNKRFLLAHLSLILLLLGCRLNNSAFRSQPDPGAAYGVERDEAIYLLGGQPRTLDPAKTLGGPSGALGHIFSGLVTLDTSLQIQPDLAAGWTVSEDGLVYTFYLWQSAVFHNGRPVTAADVVYSWERAARPNTSSDTASTYLGDIEGVQAVLAGEATTISGLRILDDHTLEVRLVNPVVYFLAKLAYPVAFVVDRENVTQSDWEYQPNGTGPFSLEVWQDDDIMVLARHEHFYREPAQISHLVYLLGPGLSMTQYETGQIDVVGIGGDTLARAQDPNNPLSQELRTTANMCTSVLGLNNRLPPLDDVRVRQALNFALDKVHLINTFANGNSLVAHSILPPGMPGYNLEAKGYPYDPEKARQLLAEAGYGAASPFPPITFYISGYDDVGPYLTAIITMWQENLGIEIEPVLIDPFTYYDELYRGNIGHIFSSGWCADYPDPQNFLEVLYQSDSSQNLSGFSDTAVDALLAQAQTEPDVTARLQLYQEAEAIIMAQAPVVFINHSLSSILVKPYLQDYVLTPIGVPQWHYVSRQE